MHYYVDSIDTRHVTCPRNDPFAPCAHTCITTRAPLTLGKQHARGLEVNTLKLLDTRAVVLLAVLTVGHQTEQVACNQINTRLNQQL